MPQLPELVKALLIFTFFNRIAEELLNFYKCYRAYALGKAGNSQLDAPRLSGGKGEGFSYHQEPLRVSRIVYTEQVKINWDEEHAELVYAGIR